jgi:hypothetical protein
MIITHFKRVAYRNSLSMESSADIYSMKAEEFLEGWR